MSLAEHTRSIIALAWSRLLGLADEELLGTGSRHELVTADGSAVTFVRLFDHTVLSGPAEVLRHGRGLEDAELADERRLLEISRPHSQGARTLGSARLLYAEEPPALDAAQRGAVSYDPAHVGQVLTWAGR